MEVQIKKAVKAGNSSAVVLPRAWLNKEVRIELVRKTSEAILFDLLEILEKNIPLKTIIGIYLVGSHARGEENEDSDIDALVITDDIDKDAINEGIYSILIVSKQLLEQKLENDLFPVGQMIREAKALINASYLESLKVKVTKKNVKWYLETTGERINQIKKILGKAKKGNKKHIDERIAYTLILRIRTLEIIKKLIQNRMYSKKDFLKLIKKVSGGIGAYEGYKIIKNKEKEKNKVPIEEAESLLKYLEKDLEKVRVMIKKLKRN